MMHAWLALRRFLIKALEISVMFMVALLTLTVLWGVFTRFCIGKQAPYTDELARVLLVWVSMIGAALAFGEKAHLGVDFFVNKLDAGARKTLSILVQLVVMTLATVALIAGGWGLAMGQMSQQLPTMPWMSRGMVYLCIPLGGCFMLLFALENLIEIFKTPAEQLGAQTKSEG